MEFLAVVKQMFLTKQEIISTSELTDEEILHQIIEENYFFLCRNFTEKVLPFLYNYLFDLLVIDCSLKITKEKMITEKVKCYQRINGGYFPIYSNQLVYKYTVLFDETNKRKIV